ncbi:hypothetical protein PS914_00432 [Pseudomonas fluorescens]|uniref:Uncharacterized protein n=1 Tax=Pseudomonas fluorescens TaxID=294 RepID=A0A5E7CX92_PSEFL|nr:hypothetical protein PS833_03332 [Pseudomonas fluorescens]VVP66864.1 hypothetical protein PS914_00432 [Pseudomonas fluorescens]
MRSINPYKIWPFPLRNSQSRNAPPSILSHRLSVVGGGK